jgi:hypothetical protein
MATGTATQKVFEGRTIDAEAPFVSGEFWEAGKMIRGEVVRIYETILEGKKSLAYVVELDGEHVEIDGEDWERVSIGNLAGFRMALQAAGIERLFLKDTIEMECESVKAAKKQGYSPRANFRIRVTRS